MWQVKEPHGLREGGSLGPDRQEEEKQGSEEPVRGGREGMRRGKAEDGLEEDDR